MSETAARYVTTATPIVPDRLAGLEDWERSALAKLAHLRSEKKQAIIFMTAEGVLLIFSAIPVAFLFSEVSAWRTSPALGTTGGTAR